MISCWDSMLLGGCFAGGRWDFFFILDGLSRAGIQ